jgi:hypothetical protein
MIAIFWSGVWALFQSFVLLVLDCCVSRQRFAVQHPPDSLPTYSLILLSMHVIGDSCRFGQTKDGSSCTKSREEGRSTVYSIQYPTGTVYSTKERANRPPRPRPHGITDHGTRQKVTVNCKVMSYESLIGSDWMSSCDL